MTNRIDTSNHLPNVVVMACNQFSPFHISVPCLVFGSEMLKETLFNVTIVAAESGPIVSKEGLQIHAPGTLTQLVSADIVIVPYWRSPDERPNQPLLDALKQAYQNGSTIVGLCLGAYVLGYAGLLDGKRASTHWGLEQDFMQRFPNVTMDTNAMYVDDERLITSAGVAAGMDCCLHIFRNVYGAERANTVARRMVMQPHREGGQAQFIERPIATSNDHRINQLLDFLRQDLRQHHSLDELADQVAMTRRTFTRKFHQATGQSLGQWLLAEKLHHAQTLLEGSNLSIERIAADVGFQSPSSFREKFKQQFHVSPSAWRKTFKL
ncbi:HTH-type transcriptional regulator CdhR [Marinomonas gallaica]|uniref:HTH-type transcriptional regulator CdhR n=1 Tax=Marinomonas gallaica TaxID=1806667 RepID=A0A1C3JS27_9GAMM|nr:helix-turn-helix domain-containing protein [Marinomonas gallaica]SBT17916.1 HTH-type transcriptional regulator CdhR [Marinomonas gallaica]SBT20784.1 HTH-type transcriptional regulator CdhR [Marinomonas gallaica]